MAQPPLHLVIGNYNTSSWSLRAWLVLRLARLAFIETRIPLRRTETPGRIAEYSPSGKLPVLLAEGVPIWDSLAIAEFVAELEPGIWPLDPIARAEARAISAEMHSGFADLRRLMPMDVIGRFSPPGRLPRGLAADVGRITAIWRHCRARFAPHGPFLFGAFSIADCMMAPVATRFVTHGVPLDGLLEDYVDSVMSWPDMVTWCDAAAAEEAERDMQGALGVVAITRSGRVLGGESIDPATRPTAAANASESSAVPTITAPPSVDAASAAFDIEPAADNTRLEVEPATLASVAISSAASTSTSAGIWPVAGSSGDDPADEAPGDDHVGARAAASAEPEGSLLAAEPREASAPAELPSDVPAMPDQPPSHGRPVEPALAPVASQPAASDGQSHLVVAAEETPDQPSASDRPAPIAVDEGGRARPPTPRLGWIRRPVPAEQMDETEAPAANEAAPMPQRQPVVPTRPNSPAVKPIGGGILRRR